MQTTELTTEKLSELKDIVSKQINIRSNWEAALKNLEFLSESMTNLNKESNDFWNENLPNVLEIRIVMESGLTFDLEKPIRGATYVDTIYHPALVLKNVQNTTV